MSKTDRCTTCTTALKVHLYLRGGGGFNKTYTFHDRFCDYARTRSQYPLLTSKIQQQGAYVSAKIYSPDDDEFNLGKIRIKAKLQYMSSIHIGTLTYKNPLV